MEAIVPRITIITPSYNQCAFIERTITSVLNQDYPDLEYIIMDGGSTDDTIKILQKYENKLSWVSEKDNGQAHAINKGLQKAGGEIVGYLNSDDLYEPGALCTVGSFFALHPSAKWITGKCRVVDQNDQEIRKAITIYKNIWLHLRNHEVLHVLNYISQPSTFWRREVVDQVGYFDETLHYTMDYDYWLRIIDHGFRLQLLDAYLARFRIHSSSKSGSTAYAQFDEEFNVARRYARSSLVLALHRIHRAFAVFIYRHLLLKNR